MMSWARWPLAAEQVGNHFAYKRTSAFPAKARAVQLVGGAGVERQEIRL